MFSIFHGIRCSNSSPPIKIIKSEVSITFGLILVAMLSVCVSSQGEEQDRRTKNRNQVRSTISSRPATSGSPLISPVSLKLEKVFRTAGEAADGQLPELLSDHLIEPVILPAPAGKDSVADGWWLERVQTPVRPGRASINITMESLLLSAVCHSTQIRVYSELPLIRETSVTEVEAAFDPLAFVESRWDDTSDPVGNALTTGSGGRYKNRQFSSAAGLRQKTIVGGNVEVSQRLGLQDTNSKFFVPGQQGTTKLAISYTQPLLRGRGRAYNESLIVLAQIDRGVSEGEFSSQLQSHLLDVARAYWGLYLERVTFAQKRKSLTRAEDVLQKLKNRIEIDAVASQIQRAEAEVATRLSELVRAELGVENAEARIRSLVNDPALGDDDSGVELIPMDLPSEDPCPSDLHASLITAMENRPEIGQAIQQIKAGCVRAEMSKHELLPVLNLITEAYASGLQGDYSLGDAFTDQFHRGRPSYTVGLQYEVPLYNREAKSRNERRNLELRQLRNQYETTVKALALEVEVAVSELETSFSETRSQRRALKAGSSQLEYLERRWEFLPHEGGNASLMLENLLTAQERLVRSEEAFAQAWVTYNVALVNHRRVTGELLQHHEITWNDYVDECDSIKTRQVLMSPGLDGSGASPETSDTKPLDTEMPSSRSRDLLKQKQNSQKENEEGSDRGSNRAASAEIIVNADEFGTEQKATENSELLAEPARVETTPSARRSLFKSFSKKKQ